ncbi:hypothetical protein [Streptosporangium vulgare]|uniref:hypothetical protein n=1 Tax=Streptosporangium vulgare TaxID=46190 RepID=UPI0031D61036
MRDEHAEALAQPPDVRMRGRDPGGATEGEQLVQRQLQGGEPGVDRHHRPLAPGEQHGHSHDRRSRRGHHPRPRPGTARGHVAEDGECQADGREGGRAREA